MVVFTLLRCLYIFNLSFASQLFSHQANFQNRTVMHDKIGDFIDSIALYPSQAQSLNSELGKDSNLEAFLCGRKHSPSALIILACKTARACLGADSIVTQPVNQTEVDKNWLVLSSGYNLKTDHCDEGLRHAGSLRLVL